VVSLAADGFALVEPAADSLILRTNFPVFGVVLLRVGRVPDPESSLPFAEDLPASELGLLDVEGKSVVAEDDSLGFESGLFVVETGWAVVDLVRLALALAFSFAFSFAFALVAGVVRMLSGATLVGIV